MTKIIRDGKTIEFDRIVAYGCSFVAGSELIDHLPLSYLGDVDAVDAVKRSFKTANDAFFKKHFDDAAKEGKISPEWVQVDGKFDYHKLFVEQVKYTFVNRLADKLGVSCLNKGWGGASINSVPYSIEHDIANGVINDTDLIVVGITSPNRWFYLTGIGEVRHPLYGWMSDQWPSEEIHDTFVLHFSNNYNIAWEYFKHIKYIEMLNEKMGNRIIVVPIFEKFQDLFRKDAYYVPQKWDSGSPESFTKIFEQISEFKSIFDCSFCEIVDLYDNTLMHGHWHPKIEHHEAYSELLYSRMKQIIHE